MTVLVTGAGGFVGGAVLAALHADGRAVRGLDLAFPVPLPDGVETCTGSILDPLALSRALDGACGVIHAAAIADLWTRRAADYTAVNVEGTRRVMAAAGSVPKVHVSSAVTRIGSATRPGDTVSEDTVPGAMLGAYPASKAAAEAVAVAAGAVVVLPSAPVGPGDWRPTPPGRMIRDLCRGRVPALLRAEVDLVPVEALAAGIVSALDRGVPGRSYLMSGAAVPLDGIAAEVASVSDCPAPRMRVPLRVALAAARVEAGLAAVTGRAPTAPLTGVRLAARPVHLDVTRAATELGFAPGDVRAAIRAAARWHLAQEARRDG